MMADAGSVAALPDVSRGKEGEGRLEGPQRLMHPTSLHLPPASKCHTLASTHSLVTWGQSFGKNSMKVRSVPWEMRIIPMA